MDIRCRVLKSHMPVTGIIKMYVMIGSKMILVFAERKSLEAAVIAAAMRMFLQLQHRKIK